MTNPLIEVWLKCTILLFVEYFSTQMVRYLRDTIVRNSFPFLCSSQTKEYTYLREIRLLVIDLTSKTAFANTLFRHFFLFLSVNPFHLYIIIFVYTHIDGFYFIIITHVIQLMYAWGKKHKIQRIERRHKSM